MLPEVKNEYVVNKGDESLRLNIGLLKAVQIAIARYPKHHQMGTFGDRVYEKSDTELYSGMWAVPATLEPACGTACCNAGWSVFLNDPRTPLTKYFDSAIHEGIDSVAQILLGIDYTQSDALFYFVDPDTLDYLHDPDGRLCDITPRQSIALIEALIRAEGAGLWWRHWKDCLQFADQLIATEQKGAA